MGSKVLVFLACSMVSLAGHSALFTYTGSFDLDSSVVGDFTGTWSFTAEDSSLNLAPYQRLIIPLESLVYSADPFESTVYGVTNSTAELRAAYNGALYLDVYGNPNGSFISYGAGWSADDFSLTYSFGSNGGSILTAHLSDDLNFHNHVSSKSGTISSAAAVVPLPAAVWLFGAGLFAVAGLSRCPKSA